MFSNREDARAWIEDVIERFICPSENYAYDKEREPVWERPLVGVSRGDDPIFEEFKSYVGPFHWTPREVFKATFPESDAMPEDLSVISWVLPQTTLTKKDNRKEDKYPSRRWARSRIIGESINVALRAHVVAVLKEKGIDSVSPMLSPLWERRVSAVHGFSSTWSERHVAYASGLGTFGLSDGLITAVGKAHRLGSVVTRLKITPDIRPCKNHHGYCLYFMRGICGECIHRCPAGAITEKGHDKEKCEAYLYGVCAAHIKNRYGFDEGYGCGLCQTDVPCESSIPTVHDVQGLNKGYSSARTK